MAGKTPSRAAMNAQTTLFLSRDDAELRQKIGEVAPQIEIVSRAQLKDHPERIEHIEIAYGGLGRDQIANATALKWFQNGGAGVNGLLSPELAARDVTITSVSGIHARCIAEHLFGMLLSLTRELHSAREAQNRREWKPLGANTLSLYGKTLGVLGVGAIGAQIARVGRAFEMKPIGLRRGRAGHPEIETMFSPENRLEFFAQAQIVMNTLPLTDATRGFMGEAEFEALPDGAIVLNAGRGATIDTTALLRGLQSGKLRAALLDVTDPEPLPAAHPLWEMPNVFITAHYAGAHPEYNAEADAIFLDNLRLYLAGEPLHHVVDKTAGY
ncbi:MAG: D-2-hydroxyacid dehydrogenase [Armatimonadetes bacterium]|nr:D-2-hydroxyacid dehydrogenase [Armatimonadota bacterium]